MEFVGQPSSCGACNLLGVPGLSSVDLDDDEGDIVIGIRPKSSPQPRRRTSVSDEDSDPEPPLCGSRRVSFADAKGLSLVQVKEFDTWDVPKLPGYESPEGEGNNVEEYVLLALTFSRPLTTEELFASVREQKVELETLELLQGTTILKGVIRVLNMSFDKAVYIRTTLDSWSTHFDLLAEYIHGSGDGVTDCFSFRLTLVPPFGEHGARVDFCLRYETPVGTFWSNNNNRNYVVSCQRREKDENMKPCKENLNLNKKSCLKIISQNFSTVENISAMEDSSQGDNSTALSSHGVDVGTIPAIKTCNSESETSEEHKQKLLVENRQNSSRRSRRKAARMAKVKDYFAQRGGGGGVNDTERDDSPSQVKVAADKNPQENHRDVQSLSERNRSEGSQSVSVAAESRGKLLQDDTSAAHDHISNSESVKSEAITSADSDTLPRGDSATDLQDKLVHADNESALAEKPNINAVVTEAEESSQNQNMNDTHTNSIPSVSRESLVSQTGCFTFGTVVAPLYQQVFGRVGSESKEVADWGNPVWERLTIGDMNPHTESRANSCIDPPDAKSDNKKVEGRECNNQEPTSKFLNSPLNKPIQGEKSSLSGTVNGVVDSAETPDEIKQHVCTSQGPKLPLEDTGLSQTGNILSNEDLLESQVSRESIDLQGDTLKQLETLDLESQITAETLQLLLPEQTHSQTKTSTDETQGAKISPPSSAVSTQSCQKLSENVIEETEQPTHSIREDNSEELKDSKTDTSVREDELFDVKHELHVNHNDTVDLVPCALVEEADFATLDTTVETHRETDDIKEDNEETRCSKGDEIQPSGEITAQGEVDGTQTETLKNMGESHGDIVVVGPKGQDTLKIKEHPGVETPVSKQDEGTDFTEFTGVKNWEAMVEEEENIIIGEEGGDIVHAGYIKTKQEKNEETVEEFMEKTTTLGVKQNEELRSEDNLRVRENNTEKRTGTEETTDVEIEIDYLRITNTEMLAKDTDCVEKTEVQETMEPEEKDSEIEKHFTECEKVLFDETNSQQEKDGNETMGTDINNEAYPGVRREDQILPEEGIEVSLHHKEDMVNEGDDSLHADSCNSIYGEDSAEESLEVMKYVVEADYLSAVVNDVQEGIRGRVTDKDNGEKQNEHFQTAIYPHGEEEEEGKGEEVREKEEEEDAEEEENVEEEEDMEEEEVEEVKDEEEEGEEEEEFETNTFVTHGPSRAESDPEDMRILTDEPEIDQASNDSTSAESDSDDEVELYMHCLRAVSSGAPALKDRNSDAGITVSKRPSISKSKLLSTPMPSISESLDEEQQLSYPQENHEDAATAAAAALTASSGQESVNQNISWWKDTFSCSNISKTLLYTTLLVVFLVVAYHYDFLACVGLYLISVVWLYCQRERQPAKNNNRIG